MLTVRAGGGCLDIFSLVCHFFSFFFSPSPLGEGPISTEILSQRAVKPNTTNQLKLKKNILSSRGGCRVMRWCWVSSSAGASY